MLAFSVQKGSRSYKLIDTAKECVIAVPGESLAKPTLAMGLETGDQIDKIEKHQLSTVDSEVVAVPGLAQAIANLECQVAQVIGIGDHRTAFVEVKRFGVNIERRERCLLSVGPWHEGYALLAQKGIHRIGVVNSTHSPEWRLPNTHAK